MLKSFTRPFTTLILSSVLLLIVWLGFPGVAQADKPSKPVVFDPAGTAVNVANIYETTPTTQKDIISDVLKSSKSFYKKATGFSGFSVLKSEDGTRVVTLTQWQDPESYEAALAAPAEDSKSSKKKDKATLVPARTIVYEVDQAQVPEGITPSLRGGDSLVQFSEITAKSPDDQPKLLAAAEQALPGLAALYPAPRSAILLRSVDSSEVALLADWGYSSAEFTDPEQFPTFSPISTDLADLADTDQRLYEVVKVIAPKTEKEKDKD